MNKTWTIPTYTYDQSTMLGGLVETFLRANGNDKAGLARTLGVSTGLVDRWLGSELTESLASRYKRTFETVTGIDLERLYVIIAKREILKKIEDIEKVRKGDSAFARLLTRDPHLARKIDFATLTTRNEIIETVQAAGKICGFPLVALQIGVDTRQLSKWQQDGGWRPSGEHLERTIIGLVSGLICSDPNDTRFQVAAEAILGGDFKLILGVATLPEAIEVLIGKQRDDPATVIANRTGLTPSIVETLKSGKPTGNIPVATITLLMRSLFKRKHKEHLSAFDRAAEQFKEDYNKGRIELEPLRLQAQVTAPAEEAREPLPAAKPAREESHPELPKFEIGFGPAQVRALAAALVLARSTADAQLQALALQFPGLLTLTPASEPQRASASQDQLEIEQVVASFTRMIDLVTRICSLSEDRRGMILHELDPLLVRLQETLQAAGVKEPQEYLRMLANSQSAAGPFGGSR